MEDALRKDTFLLYDSTAATWQAMYRAICHAKKSIFIEMFIFIDDESGNLFYNALERKARAGVEVRIIIDRIGSFWMSNSRITALRAAGVDVRIFNEVHGMRSNWWKRLYGRLHKKVVIIDETIGFIGGVNIAAGMRDWLDVHMEITGPTVYLLAESFARSYIICGGEEKNVQRFLLGSTPSAGVEFITDVPDQQRSIVAKKYADIFMRAKERIILFTPYFFPDRHFLRALRQACRRRVHVDLLLPRSTDNFLATYSGYHFLPRFRRLGAHIYFLKEMMHGKGMIIDDEAVIIGSSNMDQTSFYDNYEANLLVRDPAVVRKMKEITKKWMRNAVPFQTKEWKKRGSVHRFKEYIAYQLFRLWHRRPV